MRWVPSILQLCRSCRHGCWSKSEAKGVFSHLAQLFCTIPKHDCPPRISFHISNFVPRAQACLHLYTVRRTRWWCAPSWLANHQKKREEETLVYVRYNSVHTIQWNTSMDHYNYIYHFGDTNDHLASFLLQYFNIYILNAGVKYILFYSILASTRELCSRPAFKVVQIVDYAPECSRIRLLWLNLSQLPWLTPFFSFGEFKKNNVYKSFVLKGDSSFCKLLGRSEFFFYWYLPSVITLQNKHGRNDLSEWRTAAGNNKQTNY